MPDSTAQVAEAIRAAPQVFVQKSRRNAKTLAAQRIREWLTARTIPDPRASTSLAALFGDLLDFVACQGDPLWFEQGLTPRDLSSALVADGYAPALPMPASSRQFVQGLRLRLSGLQVKAALCDEVAAAPPKFPCAMFDIESCSLHPGAALVFSLGVLPYRLTAAGPEIGPGLIIVFNDLAWQLINLRRVDPKTQEFWFKQPKAASDHFVDPDYQPPPGVTLLRTGLRQLAPHLKAFLDQHCTPDREILSQGIGFDVPNLAAAMMDAGHQPPWLYNRVVDARTLRNRHPKRRTAPNLDLPAAAHDPIHDALKQCWGVWEVASDADLGVDRSADTVGRA